MVIHKKENNDTLYVEIVGQLDASSALQLDQAIADALGQRVYHHIIFACEGLEYISSAGVGVFISHHEDAREQECLFQFTQMRENVLDVFKVLGLDEIFDIEAELN